MHVQILLKLSRYFVDSSNAGPAGPGDTTGGVDDVSAPALSLLHHTTRDIKQNKEPPSVIQDNFPPRSACFVTQQLKPSLHLHCSLITGQKNVGTKPPPDNKYNFLKMRVITYNGN